MSYYLVDFENVKSRGMEGVELLTEGDTVCIFYSNNADSMTFDLHRKLNETKAHIIYHKVAVGTKNALDFQLATYLGYLICDQQKSEQTQEYYIVTKDNGFYSLLVYWKAEGVPVRIIRNLMWGKNQEAVPEETIEEPQMPEEVSEEILEINAVAEPADTIPEIWETTVPEIIELEKIENDYEIKTEDRTNIAFEANTVIAVGDAEVLQETAPFEKATGKKKNTRKKVSQNGKTAETKTENKAENKAVTENKQKAKKTEKLEQTEEELTRAVEAVLKEKEIVPQVVKFIRQYKTKQGINNALNKEFKDTKRTSEIYSAIKPLIADKKGK